MARHRSPLLPWLTTVDIRGCSLLLSVVVLTGVLDAVLSSRARTRERGNSYGMTAPMPRRPSNATARRPSPELATLLSPAYAAALASSEDSAALAGDRRAFTGMEGTYLPEMMAERGSQLKRWVERLDDPIRVWIGPGDSVPGFRPSFAIAVRNAFLAWEQTGVPIRFAFVDSSSDAEVQLDWADSLPGRRAGLVHWWTNAEGWLTRADVVLAMQLSDDGRADETSMHRMALHEIGHLLGLEHSLDTSDIMAAWVNANELTARDRATARMLYTLPPGSTSAGVGARGS